MPSDDLELIVGGRSLSGWEEVEIQRSLEAIAGSFTVRASDKGGWPVGPQSSCEIKMQGELALTGFVDQVRVSLGPREHSIEVAGRDKAGDLVDCSATNLPGHWDDVNLYDLVAQLCDPFQLTVVGAVDLGDPFVQFALQPGESVYEAIERACRLRAILATSDGLGRVILTRAKQDGTAVDLVEGQNLESIALTIDDTGRYRDYIVRGQQQASDIASVEDAAGSEGRAVDEGARANRTLILIAEGQVSDRTAEKRARWEATVRAARASPVSAVVTGWRQVPGGPLWQPNQLTNVHSPTLRIDMPMLVVSVRMRRSLTEGTITELGLVRPDAFLPERIPTAEDDPGGLGGEDLEDEELGGGEDL
jgi:prophage tail gpP-like protein